MCEPLSFVTSGLVVEQPRHVVIIRERVPCPSLPLSVPLQDRLAALDRVYEENVARINQERDENIAAIDRKHKLVDEALSAVGPDTTYWLWVVGFGAAAGIVQLLRALA